MRSKKRIAAAVFAVLLAVLGVGALVVYTNGAQDRAFAGRQTVSVLRVTEKVPAGTKASDLGGKVEQVKLPRAAVPDGALDSVDSLGDRVTVATLVPGEVLVAARFMGSTDLKGSGPIEVPPGKQELTIELASTRVLGGALHPGDRVGVVASYESPKTSGYDTNFAVNKALVVAVNGGGPSADGSAVAGTMQIRLALTSDEVEKVVNASEFGKVWLSRQNNGAKTGSKVIDPPDVVKAAAAAAAKTGTP